MESTAHCSYLELEFYTKLANCVWVSKCADITYLDVTLKTEDIVEYSRKRFKEVVDLITGSL